MQYVLLTILLTVYGQLIIKWQVATAGVVPAEMQSKFIYLCKLILNPWVISSFIAAFIAAMSWMLAMSKVQLSYAYPFMSLSFILVLICSGILFYEPITWQKIVGIIFIMLGVSISAYK